MFKLTSRRNIYLYTLVLLLVLFIGRGYMALWDFSYFFVAGTDFTDTTQTPAQVWVQQGQGYDGQFFYRYSLNPFDFSKNNYGVDVDLVPYRMQRIMYPLVNWVFSLGGNPAMVPFIMILINALAFAGIVLFSFRLSEFMPRKDPLVFAPLLLCGIYMSIARCLSEPLELFFFMGAVYFLLRKKYFYFAFFGSLTVLTRETSIVALLPIVLVALFQLKKSGTSGWLPLLMLVPFIVLASWKTIIILNTGTQPVQGTGNITWPLLGIINGFLANMDVSSAKNKLQMIFYIGYFIWQIVLICLVIKSVRSKSPANISDFKTMLLAAYICWMIFAIFLSESVYIDDWAFMRIFALWNMTGFILVTACNQKLPRLFVSYSVFLVILTLARLIIRP